MTEPTAATKTDKSKFTGRNVAKMIVKTTVQYKVTKIAANVLVDHTDLEADDLIVKLGSRVIGWGVAENLEPYTDQGVDITFSFVGKRADSFKTRRQAKKAAKEAKKNATEEK